jgi:ubiquinone biosynthesis protein
MNMDIPLQQISLANLINNLMEISFKYRVRMPADLTILAKTLLTMEGILSHLDKDLSIIDMAHPFGEKLIRERLKPSKIMKETRNKLREIQTFLTQLMKSGSSITKDGKIHVEISVPEVKNLSKKLDRVTNQLSFSIILLAFSIMMVGLVVGASISNVKTFLWNFPVVEVGGVVATLMFLWLLFSILKHGKF